MGGVAVETADLLTVDVQVQMALAIDMVAVDVRGGERHAVDRDQGVVARLRILHDLDRHLRRVACPPNPAGITMAVCTVVVRGHIDGHRGDDRLAVDGVGAMVVGRKFDHDGDLAFGHAGEIDRLVVEALDLRAIDVEVEVPLTLDVRRGCSLGSDDEVGRVDRDVDAASRVGLDTDVKGRDVGTLEVDGRPVVVIVRLMIATGVVFIVVVAVTLVIVVIVVVVFLVDGLHIGHVVGWGGL